uniref:FAD-binding PCMH-type domain-containing protein n=1 Tax=Fagus sylvatica TaxID=28930 RepID=A0A2N9IH80_FAGSY
MPKTTLLTPAVVCSKKNGLQIRIRSGGHDYAGISYVSDVPFIILDMFNLRSITVDMNEQTAWVQTGATLGELYYSIWKKSKVHAFPAGVCPTVGVGGHVSGAGYGNMLRKYGLTTDNVVDARIVDVNGRILDKNSMGEDLFWVRILEELVDARNSDEVKEQVAPDHCSLVDKEGWNLAIFRELLRWKTRADPVFNPGYGGKMKIPITETAFAHPAGNLFKKYSVMKMGELRQNHNNTAGF